MSVQLVFETHSTTLDNERGLATGWLPGELSDEGRLQAAELGRRRRDDGLTAAFTSDLRRAVQTAEIAFRNSPVPITLDARLRESNYGILNGTAVSNFIGQRAQRIVTPYPEGESYAQVVERMRSFLDEIRQQYIGARLLLIGHTATKWSLDHLLAGQKLEALVDEPFDWRPGWEYVLN